MKIPKTIKNDIKTNLISAFILLVVVVCMIAAFLGKMTFTDAGVFIGTIGALLSGFGFRFSADSKKEETTNE